VLTVSNAITLARLFAIPWLVWLLLARDYRVALALFIVSALTDLADGWLARRWNQRTRFGAIADPIADKLTMLAVVGLTAWQGLLPVWFAALSIGRDVVIVTGAAAYRLLIGRFEVTPTWLSKWNTALEFTLLSSVLAIAADVIGSGVWYRALLFATTATIVASGGQYVWIWGRQALAARRAGAGP
jgi:cardiolipin synthase (CMP-forming)